MLPPSGGIFDYDHKIVEIQDEERITHQADFWNNSKEAEVILKDIRIKKANVSNKEPILNPRTSQLSIDHLTIEHITQIRNPRHTFKCFRVGAEAFLSCNNIFLNTFSLSNASLSRLCPFYKANNYKLIIHFFALT